jgi:hypothetical protein
MRFEDHARKVKELQEENAALNKRAEDLEFKYRRALWLRHGHMALYGDDGEMQCGKCVIDFKRTSLEVIEAKLQQLAMDALTTVDASYPLPATREREG